MFRNALQHPIIVWVAMYSRRTFVLKWIFFAVFALVGTTLSENDGVQIFRPPLLILGVMPIWDPNICPSTYVGHLSTNFHSVGVFLWVFWGTELIDFGLFDFINQTNWKCILTNFRSTGSKTGIH